MEGGSNVAESFDEIGRAAEARDRRHDGEEEEGAEAKEEEMTDENTGGTTGKYVVPETAAAAEAGFDCDCDMDNSAEEGGVKEMGTGEMLLGRGGSNPTILSDRDAEEEEEEETVEDPAGIGRNEHNIIAAGAEWTEEEEEDEESTGFALNFFVGGPADNDKTARDEEDKEEEEEEEAKRTELPRFFDEGEDVTAGAARGGGGGSGFFLGLPRFLFTTGAEEEEEASAAPNECDSIENDPGEAEGEKGEKGSRGVEEGEGCGDIGKVVAGMLKGIREARRSPPPVCVVMLVKFVSGNAGGGGGEGMGEAERRKGFPFCVQKHENKTFARGKRNKERDAHQMEKMETSQAALSPKRNDPSAEVKAMHPSARRAQAKDMGQGFQATEKERTLAPEMEESQVNQGYWQLLEKERD